jgi:hypothetical protein
MAGAFAPRAQLSSKGAVFRGGESALELLEHASGLAVHQSLGVELKPTVPNQVTIAAWGLACFFNRTGEGIWTIPSISSAFLRCGMAA